MARQKGIIKLKGTIGDVSFYKTKDGYLAREKGGVDGDRIKNDPAFQRGLHLAAEKCKIELSTKPEADFHFVVPERNLTWHKRITREDFDALAQQYASRAPTPVGLPEETRRRIVGSARAEDGEASAMHAAARLLKEEAVLEAAEAALSQELEKLS